MCPSRADSNLRPWDLFCLTQRRLELGKTDPGLAIYPVAEYDFEEVPNWTDEVPTQSRAYPDEHGAGAGSEVNRQRGPRGHALHGELYLRVEEGGKAASRGKKRNRVEDEQAHAL